MELLHSGYLLVTCTRVEVWLPVGETSLKKSQLSARVVLYEPCAHVEDPQAIQSCRYDDIAAILDQLNWKSYSWTFQNDKYSKVYRVFFELWFSRKAASQKVAIHVVSYHSVHANILINRKRV